MGILGIIGNYISASFVLNLLYFSEITDQEHIIFHKALKSLAKRGISGQIKENL